MEEVRHRDGLRHSIGELITCPFCLDIWIAAGFTIGLVFAPRLTGSSPRPSPPSPARTSCTCSTPRRRKARADQAASTGVGWRPARAAHAHHHEGGDLGQRHPRSNSPRGTNCHHGTPVSGRSTKPSRIGASQAAATRARANTWRSRTWPSARRPATPAQRQRGHRQAEERQEAGVAVRVAGGGRGGRPVDLLEGDDDHQARRLPHRQAAPRPLRDRRREARSETSRPARPPAQRRRMTPCGDGDSGWRARSHRKGNSKLGYF